MRDMLALVQARPAMTIRNPATAAVERVRAGGAEARHVEVLRPVADFLVGQDDTSRARLVQFHPAYSYEEFVEGIRVRNVEVNGRQVMEDFEPADAKRFAAAVNEAIAKRPK